LSGGLGLRLSHPITELIALMQGAGIDFRTDPACRKSASKRETQQPCRQARLLSTHRVTITHFITLP